MTKDLIHAEDPQKLKKLAIGWEWKVFCNSKSADTATEDWTLVDCKKCIKKMLKELLYKL